MKNKLLPLFLVLAFYTGYSQVGIGTTTPDVSSQLDIASGTRGLLIPRVNLTSLTSTDPIVRKPDGTVTGGLLVFNMTDDAPNLLSPGYYYWTGAPDNKWTRITSNSDARTIARLEANTPGPGRYLYTDELGAATSIDVVGDVKNNVTEIFNDPAVNTFLNTYLTENIEGNVTYDGDKFSYVTGGVVTEISLADLVTGAETETNLVPGGDGRYEYFNEKRATEAPVTIDVLGDVINNASRLFDGDTTSNTFLQEFNQYVTDNPGVLESETTLTGVVGSPGVYEYENEKKVKTRIDVVGDVIGNVTEIFNDPAVSTFLATYMTGEIPGIVTYVGGNLTYIDQTTGTRETFNEKETTLEEVVGSPGVYKYTNEAGTTTTINVVGDVKNNISEIFNDPAVNTFLNTYLTENIEGNVTYDGDKFSYVTGGVVTEISIADLVTGAETETNLVSGGDGRYEYYNEKRYAVPPVAPVTIDVLGDVINNASRLFDGDTTSNTFLQEFNQYVTDNPGVLESETTLTGVVGSPGVYEYENEKKVKTRINVVGDVKNNISEIFNDPAVNTFLNTYLTENIEGNVTYDGDKFSYVTGGVVTEISIADLVTGAETETELKDNSDGTITYTNEKRVPVTINKGQIWKTGTIGVGIPVVDPKVANPGDREIFIDADWIGIGTDQRRRDASGTGTEKLFVNGSILTVNSSYADYVFEDYFDGASEIKEDYKFKSLKEVDEFIKENRHLPGVTPITDLKKTDKGYDINISALSVQSLEKIEELYLHVIELQKQMEEKDREYKERIEKLEKLLSEKNK